MKSLVIYHADCTDGFGAAFAAWLKLGDKAEYLPMQYGFKPHEMPAFSDRVVYMLDFSWPRDLMCELFEKTERVVWLDHHKTAFEMWCGAIPRSGYWIRNDGEVSIPPLPNNAIVRLNDHKSGALLAWEHFHPDTKVPALIRHIDDRDRWQFKLEGSRELHAALQSYKPWSFEQWRNYFWSPYTGDPAYFEEELERLLSDGVVILRAQEQNIASMLKQARKCEIFSVTGVPFGTNPKANMRQHNFAGLALNAPMHMSEVGHELANQSSTYGLVWYMGMDNRVKCSLRSNGEYDVSAIARAFGGGGHRNAAGFEIDIQTLIQWLK